MQSIKSLYKNYKQLIPVLVLSGFCIFTVATFFNDKIVNNEEQLLLNLKHYAGFSCVIICVISFFKFRHFYKYLLLVTLMLGFANFINFTPSTITNFIGFGSLEIGFQPTSFLAILSGYVINHRRANKFIIRQIQSLSNENQTFEEELNLNKIDRFKDRYKEYPDNKLQQILNENEFVPEALEVARIVLKQRKISINPPIQT